jgi:hypothetical protein
MEMEIRQGRSPILPIQILHHQAVVHLLATAHLLVEAALRLYGPFHVAVVDNSHLIVNANLGTLQLIATLPWSPKTKP